MLMIVWGAWAEPKPCELQDYVQGDTGSPV